MRFGVLGPLLALVGGRDVRFDGPRQAKVLAALLVDANQVVPIPRLVRVMWDREGPATATRQVQDAVSGLRRILTAHGAAPGLITTHRGGYRIGLQAAELDLFDFEQQVGNAEKYFTAGDAAGAVGALRQALGLWRSEALTDLAGQALAARAAQLDGRRIAVHRQCLEIELTLGRHHGIVEELSGLVKAHPFDEGLAELAMLALHRCGRRADALALYRELRGLFRTELGIAPNPGLQQLHQAILTEAAERIGPRGPADPADPTHPATLAEVPPDIASFDGAGGVPATTVPTPRQLPRDPADFVGRTSAVEYLCRTVTLEAAGSSGPVAVVTGPAGIGKSALAGHVGHRVAAAFPGGQLYADLRGTGARPADPCAVLASFVRALAGDRIPAPASLDEAAAAFRSLAAGLRLLVVLDDARDAEQVSPLLPAGSGCAVLITSRSRLSGLDCVRRVVLDRLGSGDARTLLARIAEPEAGADEPAEPAAYGEPAKPADPAAYGDPADPAESTDPDALTAIAHACAGSPLALRIAGNRLAVERGLTARDLAGRLADPERRLDELTIAGRSVRAALAVHTRDLPDGAGVGAGAVRVLSLLALWESPEIGLPTVAALADLPVEECRHLLDVLVDLHLVESPRPDRYAVSGLPRLYAAELAAALPRAQRNTAVGGAAAWYLRTLTGVNAAPADPDALAWLDLERPNLIEAVRGAAGSGHPGTAWRLAVGLQDFFLLRNHLQDWIRTHDIVLALADAIGDDARARILIGRGAALIELGDPDGAERCLVPVLAIPGTDATADVRTAGLIALGRVRTAQGRGAEAVETLGTAIRHARRSGDALDEATARAEQGRALSGIGNQDAAIAACRRALGLLPVAGSRTEGVILGYLGDALRATRDLDGALACHRRALVIHAAADDKLRQADALVAIGDLLTATGRGAKACHAWTAATDLYEALAHPRTDDVRERLRSAILA
ncbi:MAG: BTAD domain-containing putative transcriptional regulator [Catenulispora sp.]